MKRTAAVLLLCLMCLPSCRSTAPSGGEARNEVQGRLERFFRVRQKDLANALEVIKERDLIKILTHLHRMNDGGRKYYLLEREAITEMIRAVTEDIYSDFILVNRHGVVIYTRDDDDIFGKSVTTSLKDTPLARSFRKKNDFAIEDAVEFPVLSGRYCIHVSSEVMVRDESHGVFVLQVDIGRILEILDKETCIIDRGGLYRVHADTSLMLTPAAVIEDVLRAEKSATGPSFMVEVTDRWEVTPFSFRDLDWLVLKKVL